MALENYTDLKASVATWLHRSDLTTEIVDGMTLAEKRLNRKLRLLQMETDVTVTLADESDTITFPAGWLEHIDLRYDTDEYQPTQVSLKDLHSLTSISESRPNMYAVTSLYRFNQTADKAYSMTNTYYKGFDLETDATNFLMTNAPDAYLYGTLLEMKAFVKDAKSIALWSTGLEVAIFDLNNKDAKSRAKVITRVDPGVSNYRNNQYDIRRGY